MHFFAKFGLLFGIPYVALNALPYPPLLEAIASFQKSALESVGIAAVQNGTRIETATQLFQIVPSCTGLVMVFLMFALLYSTPVKNPARYLAVFAPALFAFNQVRLFSVLSLGTLFPAQVEPLHFFLWFVDAGLVLFLWFVAFSASPASLKSKKMPAKTRRKSRARGP